MIIVGVRFKDVRKVYYFSPGEVSTDLLKMGTGVIVETGRGAEYGVIAIEAREESMDAIEQPVRKVLRLATDDDFAQEDENRIKETEARTICLQKIEEHGLGMHLVDVELTFDLSKIIFFFTAEGRVDFRELVKDLAATFRMRIELRQIGVRDEAKLISGIGICGRILCCSSFLEEFQPVSIKSAKDQGLSLNPAKISGVCGKLMCCLKYEEDTYVELTKNMPGVGDLVRTKDGDGEVLSINILQQTVKASIKAKTQDDSIIALYPVSELKIVETGPRCGRSCQCSNCHIE